MEYFRKRLVAHQMSPFGDVGLFYSEKRNDRIFMPEELVMRNCGSINDPGYIQTGPLITFGGNRGLDTLGQELMDSLWQCGYRPSEGTGSAGSLAATQSHLSDMRKIVAAKLEVAL